MSSQSPAPKEPNGLSAGSAVLVFAAITLALAWYWFPVSIAVVPSSARSTEDVEAIAVRLTPPPGFTVNAYAVGLGQARVIGAHVQGRYHRVVATSSRVVGQIR
jgi:hypothetical protein